MRIFQSEEKFSNYYQIDSCLDSTGNGFVYKAHNTRLGNEIALKVFHSDLFPEDTDYQKFEQKAQTLGRLNHPNIAFFTMANSKNYFRDGISSRSILR